MRFVAVVTVAASGCFSTPAAPPDALVDTLVDAVVVVTPGRRKTITIVQTPDTELMRFPVAVVLPSDTSLHASASSAQNITFAQVNGAPLPCEIVAYTPATGALEAWVQMPVLSTTQHALDLVYGDEVTSPCVPTQTWPASEYRAVWHLSDANPAAARDSTANQITLTGTTAGTPVQAPGMVGGSFRFDNGDANGADQVCNPAPNLAFGLSSFSYEAWVKQDSYVGMFDVPLTKGGKAANQPGYDLELGDGVWTASVRDGSDPPNTINFTTDATTVVGTWRHLGVSVDRMNNAMTTYLDGLSTTSQSLVVESVDGPDAFCLGDATQPMIGNVDEVKLHTVARSADWFLATYRNIHDPASFLQVGPEH